MSVVRPLLVLLAVLATAACATDSGTAPSARDDTTVDDALQAIVRVHALGPISEPEPADAALIALGEALFFDPELSGNRDIACATCHFPDTATGDGLRLSIGTGGQGLGSERTIGTGGVIPRNAPDLFDRGDPGVTSMFWDGRVRRGDDGSFQSPAGRLLPGGLDSVLAVQALFPVTSRDEMRGRPGDRAADGRLNELAAVDDGDLPRIWSLIVKRLRAIPGYRELFRDAYPDTPLREIGPRHLANAVAAYESAAFSFTGSPWDRYLGGDAGALDGAEKRGALLFYGEARCSACHTGMLMTDQRSHNVGVPQIGPGKGEEAPSDLGRLRESGAPDDAYAFRTPSLRNVALTGPYMHDGAYEDLEDAVRHMLDPATALMRYSGAGLPAEIGRDALAPAERRRILDGLDPMAATGVDLTDEEFADLMAFLGALTDPDAKDLSHLTPERVPSGLPVGGAAP